MKLMGTSKLKQLACSCSEEVSGAVSALVAELEDGRWPTAAELVRSYPSAIVDGAHVHIPIEDGFCADLIVNFETEMMLIEFGGAAAASKHARKKGRRAA
ncbi:hypothetical protein ACVDG5_019735 [Mesorhizobium sp. ORM6]